MKTALYDRHCALRAKMVEFSGWEMPLQYKGIRQEHFAVRRGIGIFDVSHMGRILVSGPEAESFLDYLSTNRIRGKKDFTATYTAWANRLGGTIDDVIIYRRNAESFFVIVNAGNRQNDLAHMMEEAKGFQVVIEPLFEGHGILAIQGPKAKLLLVRFFPEAAELSSMHFLPVRYKGIEIILSGTGYTGAGGGEIYAGNDILVELWDTFLEAGKQYGVEPAGLGARDTLRLEMGYALYGHELSLDIAPNESISSWTVKWEKDHFLGKEAMQKIEGNPQKRREYGIVMVEGGIAREKYDVFKEGRRIGTVTSGTLSPTLNKAIAIILSEVKLIEGDELEVQIRHNRIKAKVTALPFYS